jgi:hypothetical protein
MNNMKMDTNIKWVMLLLMMALSSPVFAGQKADLVCVSNKQAVVKGKTTFACDTYELRVNISSEKEAGEMGVFGIYAIAEKNAQMAYWTENNGWSTYTEDDLIQPVNNNLKNIEANKEYIVYEGSLDGLCKLSNGKSFNLYAWHAVISPSQLKAVKTFIQRYEITGYQARNFFNMYLLHLADSRKTDGLIFNHSCPS